MPTVALNQSLSRAQPRICCNAKALVKKVWKQSWLGCTTCVNCVAHLGFFFTINGETKQDLESIDGRSRKGSRTRSLSDFLVSIETPPLFLPLWPHQHWRVIAHLRLILDSILYSNLFQRQRLTGGDLRLIPNSRSWGMLKRNWWENWLKKQIGH